VKSKDVLETALKLTQGDRHETYGTVQQNFQNIADLWNAYFGTSFSARDVGIAMGLLKLARTKSGKGTDDNWIDLEGYFALACELDTEVGEDKLVPLTGRPKFSLEDVDGSYPLEFLPSGELRFRDTLEAQPARQTAAAELNRDNLAARTQLDDEF
jgi:hypothetical protein